LNEREEREGGRRKEEGGRRKEEEGRRKEEGGRRKRREEEAYRIFYNPSLRCPSQLQGPSHYCRR
jgi:hypothetical protein